MPLLSRDMLPPRDWLARMQIGQRYLYPLVVLDLIPSWSFDGFLSLVLWTVCPGAQAEVQNPDPLGGPARVIWSDVY